MAHQASLFPVEKKCRRAPAPLPFHANTNIRGEHIVEFWTGPKGEPGTGYPRNFGYDWVRAACFIQELKAGALSGAY